MNNKRKKKEIHWRFRDENELSGRTAVGFIYILSHYIAVLLPVVELVLWLGDIDDGLTNWDF
jgi:hypothetical protein